MNIKKVPKIHSLTLITKEFLWKKDINNQKHNNGS